MRVDLDIYIKENSSLRKRIADRFFVDMRKRSSRHWDSVTRAESMTVFKQALKHVSAYIPFLRAHKVNPARIKTYQDFLSVPSMSKANYLRKFPLGERSIQGRKKDTVPVVFTATSGSTGEPVYFPRNHILDLQASLYHELFFRNARIKPSDNTLVIVGFGMGVWIGGLITYEAVKTMGERGYNISIITPGSNKAEIFSALKHIGHDYDHVVLVGYPPFVKDLIDEGASGGVKWKSYRSLKIICAAEMFTERFRDYIARKTGIENPLRDVMNIYGSADLGTMAVETPLAVLVRRLALKNKRLFKRLFGDANRLPTFAQYHPDFIAFDVEGKKLFLTGYSTVPLIRYEIGDHGGVLSFSDVANAFKTEGMDLQAEVRKAGIKDTLTELPFVYVYERSDFSTKLYGAIIWPEHIREALLDPVLQDDITGRFTLITKHDDKQNEYLEINVELQTGKPEVAGLRQRVTDKVTEALLQKNAEYTYLTHHMPDRVLPRIEFWPHEHPLHFKPAGKQKWVKDVKK